MDQETTADKRRLFEVDRRNHYTFDILRWSVCLSVCQLLCTVGKRRKIYFMDRVWIDSEYNECRLDVSTGFIFGAHCKSLNVDPVCDGATVLYRNHSQNSQHRENISRVWRRCWESWVEFRLANLSTSYLTSPQTGTTQYIFTLYLVVWKLVRRIAGLWPTNCRLYLVSYIANGVEVVANDDDNRNTEKHDDRWSRDSEQRVFKRPSRCYFRSWYIYSELQRVGGAGQNIVYSGFCMWLIWSSIRTTPTSRMCVRLSRGSFLWCLTFRSRKSRI